jgi:hypothetical protein
MKRGKGNRNGVPAKESGKERGRRWQGKIPALGALCAALATGACNPFTQSERPGQGDPYARLNGSWRASGDSSLVLTFTRVCCGSRPKLEGTLRHGRKSVTLDAPSFANAYPVQTPDSTTEYGFQLFSTLRFDPICALEAYVQDAAGRRGFPRPAFPDTASLAIVFSAKTAGGCDSLWEPMIFEKEP